MMSSVCFKTLQKKSKGARTDDTSTAKCCYVTAQGQAHGHSLCLEMCTISRLEKNSAVSTLAYRLPGKLSRRF